MAAGLPKGVVTRCIIKIFTFKGLRFVLAGRSPLSPLLILLRSQNASTTA